MMTMTMYTLKLMVVTTMMLLIPMFMGMMMNKWSEKNSPFECGMALNSSSRKPFSLQFFLLMILFIIFDIEIVMILAMPMSTPWMNSMIMLMMMMSSMIWMMLIMNNPMNLSLLIMMLAILMSLMYNLSMSSWYAMILFLIYVGGMMAMFSYFVSFSSNEPMSMKMKAHMLILPMIMVKMTNMKITMPSYESLNTHQLKLNHPPCYNSQQYWFRLNLKLKPVSINFIDSMNNTLIFHIMDFLSI